jgi:glycosyltransferase involved in cell wall biosynthesis
VTPFVSIVIATRNRERLLAETLDGLVQLRWPRDRFEIIVADNGSTDGTAAVVASASSAARAPEIRYLYVPQPGKSYAVNASLLLARGEIIALTDDDVLPDAGWLQHLCAAFAETGADFVAGRIFPRWETSPPPWMSPALYGVLAIPDNGDARLEIAPDQPRVVPIGANMAVRATVVERIGGLRTDLGKLDGTLRTGEDHEFFLRMLGAGYRGVYEPHAVVHHWVPRERLEPVYFRKWLYQNGRDVARLDAAHPTPATRLLGVPRYLWRQAIEHGWMALLGAVTGKAAMRVGGEVRLRWMAGYVREAWFSHRDTRPAASLETEPGQPKAAA